MQIDQQTESSQSGMPNLDSIIANIDELETELKAYVQVHRGMGGKWDRRTEKIMDKLVMLGSWVHDYMHDHVAAPDELNPVYKRSMLFRVRRALRYST